MAKTSTKKEEVLKETTNEEVSEETIEETTEGTAEETAENTPKAEAKPKDDGRVDYFLPRNLLTNEDHMEVVYNGKVCQVACGEKVRVLKGVAKILDDAIEQHTKVEKMKRDREKNTPEIYNS